MPDVQSERTRIDEIVAGRTLVHSLADTVAKYGDEPAYHDRHHAPEGEGWRTFTWQEVRDAALDVAGALVEAGVAVGETVAIMATNRVEHFLADMGAVHAAATPMSIYNTLARSQVAFIADQSQPAVVFVEGADQLDRWGDALAAVPSIRKVVVIDESAAREDDLFTTWADFLAAGSAYRRDHEEELRQRAESLDPGAPATILYTSGTTGNPKGVVLTHHNVQYEAISTLEAAGLGDPQRQVSYLPLAHIAERVIGLYGPQVVGGETYCIGDPSELLAALGEVHPTGFFGVPRVWEKIKTGLSAKLAADPDPDNQAMVRDAMAAAQAGWRPRRWAAR